MSTPMKQQPAECRPDQPSNSRNQRRAQKKHHKKLTAKVERRDRLKRAELKRQSTAQLQLPLPPEDEAYTEHRHLLRVIAEKGGEHCGLPLSFEGQGITVDERYRFAGIFEDKRHVTATNRHHHEEDDLKRRFPEGTVIRNLWYSKRRRCMIALYQTPEDVQHGRVNWGFALNSPIDKLIGTLGCTQAWGMEQEATAMRTLYELLTPHQYHCYFMTGMILESSKRSGITYLFRRLRPTVALKANKKTDSIHFLCSLCMHPIGYYTDTWAGTMCPTDDIIAHLMLMRGDEARYWKQSTQHHNIHRPEAGLF